MSVHRENERSPRLEDHDDDGDDHEEEEEEGVEVFSFQTNTPPPQTLAQCSLLCCTTKLGDGVQCI